MFYQHIAYNTLLSHIEPLAKNSKTFEEFQKKVLKLLEKDRLPMQPQELELAQALSVDSKTFETKTLKYPGTNIPASLPFPASKNTKFAEYKESGVLVDEELKRSIKFRLKQIWLSWGKDD